LDALLPELWPALLPADALLEEPLLLLRELCPLATVLAAWFLELAPFLELAMLLLLEAYVLPEFCCFSTSNSLTELDAWLLAAAC
jgi:hypothetical protein